MLYTPASLSLNVYETYASTYLFARTCQYGLRVQLRQA